MEATDARAKEVAVRRASEDRYRHLVEVHPYALLVSVGQNIVLANPAVARLLGLARTSFCLGRSLLEFVRPESRDEARALLERALARTGPSPPSYQKWQRADGTILDVEVIAAPVPWEQQMGLELAVRDLRDRRELEGQVRQLQGQLLTVTEQVTHFAVFSLNPEGRVASWNAGAKSVFGYESPEILGQDFSLLFTVEDRERGAPNWEMNQAAETGLARDERWHLKKDGTRCFLSGLLVSVRDNVGRLTGYTKVAQDQTSRKLAEDALRESEERHRQLANHLERRVTERTRHLEQSVQTWESFCYSMAHDLRAPLRTISGFAHALRDDYGPQLDATAQDYAQRMVAAAQRLDEFIQDLLDFGRLAHVELPLRAVDLNLLVDHVLAELAEDVSTTRAEIQLHRPFPIVWANPAALGQVLTNLITNALKFVSPGTRPKIDIHSESAGSLVRLWVRDYGIGISAEYQERVFELFERLHPQSAYPGTGVGLAIVRKAMERMGGTVGLQSRPGEGTAFWIELPRAPDKAG